MKNKMLTPKEIWKKAYRLARTPDKFLADDLILDFPVHYFLYALHVVNWELTPNRLNYKLYDIETTHFIQRGY
jgi:hypothetical protein